MQEIRGIDLDEVLFETMDGLLDFHNHQINGIHVTREDITDYHIHKIKKLWMDLPCNIQFWDTFQTSEKVHDIKPVAGAREGLIKLLSQEKSLISITGRCDVHKPWTYKALEKHYSGLISEVFFLNAYADLSSHKITQTTKWEICKEQWATVMVEDDLHYALELADKEIKVYLLDKPWNQQYQNGMHNNIIKVSWRKDIDI
ncbi:MAG: hypothetical protein ACD_80C00143G0004 [uncultured bacterium (gcode 4)]|uniref:Nucleotidase n=1 Tax=uncultured bacterium (gcode 4) TaxID=1234023 RepID=K1XX35_9BACT|nr:MAG: hypothetical protein ACD_80C00143G0004 [uncultured bacterium (gcode 4)]